MGVKLRVAVGTGVEVGVPFTVGVSNGGAKTVSRKTSPAATSTVANPTPAAITGMRGPIRGKVRGVGGVNQ